MILLLTSEIALPMNMEIEMLVVSGNSCASNQHGLYSSESYRWKVNE